MPRKNSPTNYGQWVADRVSSRKPLPFPHKYENLFKAAERFIGRDDEAVAVATVDTWVQGLYTLDKDNERVRLREMRRFPCDVLGKALSLDIAYRLYIMGGDKPDGSN